ncbi:hypothetical protein [Deinococcus sp.]|uniref:hypothetical protein n=1 Tax=Deinococcus sp. TaxID=47478 RepID=UPI00286D6B02|nr:hypothetical protein [Deinococcus sp.]
MIEEFVYAFNNKPRRIDKAIWDDPVLTLIGNDWTFNTICSWRIFDKTRLIGGFDSKDAGVILSAINEQEIIANIGESGLDPEFMSEGGIVLQVLVTNWSEPWVYRDDDIILVESNAL